MRGITICEPYATLIVADPAELAKYRQTPKRAENRRWYTGYRGELLIHAGLGKKYVDEFRDVPLPQLTFGAILGVASLVECIELGMVPKRQARFPWLENHPHAEGPFCLILENVRRFEKPVPWQGAQGLWRPDTEHADQRRALGQALKTAIPIAWTPK